MFHMILPSKGVDDNDRFNTVLERGLGSTISKEFYFPYAIKMWGLKPEELSAIQAKRRISASSLPKMIKKDIIIIARIKTSDEWKVLLP